MSYPSSSPQESWSFLLLRCPLRKSLFPYTSLHFMEAQFPAKGTFPNPQHHLPGLWETDNILRSQQLANLRGNNSQGWARPLRKFHAACALGGQLEVELKGLGIATSGSG